MPRRALSRKVAPAERPVQQPGPISVEAIVIGASAGAVGVLGTLLPALPADLNCPVLLVVHLPADRRSALVDLFADQCGVRVKEAEDKEDILPGVVYCAPPDHHLLVEPGRSIALSRDEPVLFSRPSIDVLFTSAADAYGDGALGIILTGANSDGAAGLKAVVDAGGTGVVQHPHEAEAATMPEAALAACPQAYVMSVPDIARLIVRDGRKK